MEKHYLDLDFKSGKFYEFAKTEKEGFERHESEKGNVSYRKYYNYIKGSLESVQKYEDKFGDCISIILRKGEKLFFIKNRLYDNRGQIATFSESLITLLPNLDKNQEITFRGYNFIPDGEKYPKRGISIKNSEGEKIKRAIKHSYYKNGELVKNDIPALEFVEKMGKMKPSSQSVEAKEDYLLDVLQKQFDRLKYIPPEESSGEPDKKKSDTAQATGQDETNSKKTEEEDLPDDAEDDLPF